MNNIVRDTQRCKLRASGKTGLLETSKPTLHSCITLCPYLAPSPFSIPKGLLCVSFHCFSSCSDLDSNRAPSDPDSKPTVPEVGVLSPMFKGDETHPGAIVRKCVADLDCKERKKHCDLCNRVCVDETVFSGRMPSSVVSASAPKRLVFLFK